MPKGDRPPAAMRRSVTFRAYRGAGKLSSLTADARAPVSLSLPNPVSPAFHTRSVLHAA